jgi:hypothetical protein
MIVKYIFVRVSIFLPPTKPCRNIIIRMEMTSSIGFFLLDEEGKGDGF